MQVLQAGVGGITESDVILAHASGAGVIGFNVRANKQARERAKRDGVDIRYYNIIYNVVDDVKAALSGMLTPETRERFLGNAEILEVFNISKVGKVAGCRVTDGVVRRGAKVRLIRDNVVIHEGDLSTLKRFKDEVREVQTGQECGMAFANYQDMQKGDVIECFEVETIQRALCQRVIRGRDRRSRSEIVRFRPAGNRHRITIPSHCSRNAQPGDKVGSTCPQSHTLANRSFATPTARRRDAAPCALRHPARARHPRSRS